MDNITRKLAAGLRHMAFDQQPAENIYPACFAAAAAIDALLDAIEAGGMVQPRPAPVMDVEPLRALRAWHHAQSCMGGMGTWLKQAHAEVVQGLNKYFPADDQL